MVDSSELLPEGACLLHIGPYKTGTSAIQTALQGARAEMRRHGVVYPGRGRRAKKAGWAVLGETPRGWDVATIDEWKALVREVEEAADLRVCVSTESFGRAEPEQAAKVVDDLGGDRVHVLSVARRLDRLLPSAWQQRVQQFRTLPYEEFLETVLDDAATGDPVHRSFWASHDVAKLVGRWVPTVGADRFILIVTDDSDRGLLLRTFEQLLGLPEGLLALDSTPNPSLAMNGVELVRRMNEVFAEQRWSDAIYQQVMRHGVIPALKNAPRSAHDLAIPKLPQWAAERVAELSAARAEAIKSLGVRLIGDPDSLRTPVTSGGDVTVTPPETIAIDSAVLAVQGAVNGALRLERKRRRQRARELRKEGKLQQPQKAKQPPRKAGKRQRGRKARTVEATSSKDLLAVVRRRIVHRLAPRQRS